VKISLKMDRFRQLYAFEKTIWGNNDYKAIVHFVNSLRKPDAVMKDAFPKAKFWKQKDHAWSHCSFELNPGHIASVGFGSIPGAKKRAYFEFNPSKLVDDGPVRLKTLLWHTLSLDTLAFTKDGHVGSAEIACDVEGASFDQYWFVDPGVRRSSTFYQSRGTVYLGALSSSHALTCYAKEKELLAKTGVELPHPILRIEAKIQPRSPLSIVALPTISNPFARLIVIDAKKLAATQTHHGLKPFRRALDASGDAQVAFFEASRRPHCSRVEIAERLSVCTADWWKPAAIWGEHCAGLIDWAKELNISWMSSKAA
jgi:hypothetical protein